MSSNELIELFIIEFEKLENLANQINSENELDVKLFPLIKSIHKDKSLLTQMKNKQNILNSILSMPLFKNIPK